MPDSPKPRPKSREQNRAIAALGLDEWSADSLPDLVDRGGLFAETWKSSDGSQPPTTVDPLTRVLMSQKENGAFKWQHYLPIYHRHLAKFIGRAVRILEVGVFGGGSLDMWRKYFGPQCEIYAIDINPAAKQFEKDGIKVFIGDQADRLFLSNLRESVPPLDIIIDDGGHRLEQQIATLEELLPHTRPGAVYACEDLHGELNSFIPYLLGIASHLNDFINVTNDARALACGVTDFQKNAASIHLYPFLALLERNDSPPEKFIATKLGLARLT